MKQAISKLKQLELILDEIEQKLEEVTTPWEADFLEKMYIKNWKEYNSILKQLED